jgi:outer membrane biosynthesis protein TonB
MASEKEKRDKRIGMAVSLGAHALLVLVFFFLLAWKEPFPPNPEYGIELNFGMEEMGSGYEQPTVQDQVREERQEEVQQEEVVEPPQEQPVDEQIEEESVVEEAIEELPDSQQEDSPVKTEPDVVDQISEKEVEDVQTVQEEVKKVVEEEKPAETPPPKPKIDERSVYPGSSSQGANKDKTGDAGSTEGDVDARALYGKSGGGAGGPSLDIAGWMWDFTPRPDDTSNENGRIVFEIKVDEGGEVIAVRTLEKTVSPTVELIYRREVERLTFSPTSQNSSPPPSTTGKITFIIRSK